MRKKAELNRRERVALYGRKLVVWGTPLHVGFGLFFWAATGLPNYLLFVTLPLVLVGSVLWLALGLLPAKWGRHEHLDAVSSGP